MSSGAQAGRALHDALLRRVERVGRAESLTGGELAALLGSDRVAIRAAARLEAARLPAGEVGDGA